MVDLTCYENVVGLSSKDCECLDNGNRPDDYNVSESGFFIDDLESLKDLQGLEDCDSDLWKELIASLKTAKGNFIADTNALILREFKLSRGAYKGGIGEAKARTLVTRSNRYLGIRAAVATVRGARMKLNGIGVLLDQDATFPVFIYNNLNELIGTVQVTAVANRHTVTPVNITLPLHNKYSDPLEYFFIYDRQSLPPGATPRNNSIDCGCGRWKPSFSCNSPYYNGYQKGRQAWANWAMFGDFYGDTLIDFDDCSCTTGNGLNGLTLDVEFGCKIQEELCSGKMDFETNPLALSMAMAIRYRAGANLLTKLLSSGTFNAYTHLNADDLAADRIEYLESYNEHVAYIVSAINVQASDCLSCRTFADMQTNGVFS